MRSKVGLDGVDDGPATYRVEVQRGIGLGASIGCGIMLTMVAGMPFLLVVHRFWDVFLKFFDII
jgi:hypothetical protein